MIIARRGGHFFLMIGDDIAQADHNFTIALGLFRTGRPAGELQFKFFFEITFERPGVCWIEGGGEFAHHWGASNSARWTGRNREITGWYWPIWLKVHIGRRYWDWRSRRHYWQPAWAKSQARRATERQERINSAMIVAQIENPRAPDWLVRARAQQIADT